MGCDCNELRNELEINRDHYDKRYDNFDNILDYHPPPLSTNKGNPMCLLLWQLLSKKFKYSSGQNIQFEEVDPDDFIRILWNGPIDFNNIRSKLNFKLNSIQFENDSKYKDINAIKITEPSGEIQYYQGSYNSRGQCHGEGIWLKDNNIYYGNFKNDEFNGQGLFVTGNGEYYFGDWKNGQCDGEGELYVNDSLAYKGNFRNNKKEGYGEEYYPDGGVYRGTFYNNQKNGLGTYTFCDGSIYEGNFKDSKYNGKGQIKWSNGNSFKGEFKDGRINGHGTYFWNDGSIFDGFFVNGRKQGDGQYIWPNGKTFRGQWNNNSLNGFGIFDDPTRGLQESIRVKY